MTISIVSVDSTTSKLQVGGVDAITFTSAGITDMGAITTVGGTPITGTNTNDSASAGVIGEFIESDIPNGSAVALVTTVAKNVTSISLTAGDWDVSATLASTILNTTTEFTGGVSLVSNTLATDRQVRIRAGAAGNLIGIFSGATQPKRISIASTTTVYLVAYAAFASGSNSAYGTISARRVR